MKRLLPLLLLIPLATGCSEGTSTTTPTPSATVTVTVDGLIKLDSAAITALNRSMTQLFGPEWRKM